MVDLLITLRLVKSDSLPEAKVDHMSNANPDLSVWTVKRWMPNLFGFHAPVGQREYAGFGLSLMLLKYLVEAITIYALMGKPYTPLDFVNPLLTAREQFTAQAPVWLGMAWVIWTLPFLWIALTMSVRRAAFLNLSPWLGLLVLVPVVNLFSMIVLALLPDSWAQPLSPEEILRQTQTSERLAEAYRPPREEDIMQQVRSALPVSSGIVASLIGILCGAAFLVCVVVLSVYLIGNYGATMFLGTPIVTCAIAAYFFNTPTPRSIGITVGHGALTVLVACGCFLVFGLEGGICIVMAAPIMMGLGVFGSIIGYTIALHIRPHRRDEFSGLLGAVLLTPLVGMIEPWMQADPVFENMTAIEINAPPERVWDHVVEFSEITSPPEWYFRLGIASPLRAHIDGAGMGAIRHCEFTTGEFVEPITVWEPGKRLAFDVTSQPEPMAELSPYRHIHPPHLDGSFKSVRGEFLLIDLGDGRTRLEGRTWYKLRIYPVAYWTVWTDAVLHGIHTRVLEQVREEAERGSGGE